MATCKTAKRKTGAKRKKSTTKSAGTRKRTTKARKSASTKSKTSRRRRTSTATNKKAIINAVGAGIGALAGGAIARTPLAAGIGGVAGSIATNMLVK